ncbi:MAG: bifunctional heptose 7-phosphate kinase/heptose 1-phosphate adenyltransferase [Vicinamibacteria bacterium]
MSSNSEPSRDRLVSLIEAFRRVKVLAVVDLVVDEYIFGQISRVSREAPVLILDYDDNRLVPGGGANAVNNIAALGGRPFAVGIVGDDAPGRELLTQLRKAKVDVSGIQSSRSYKTPTKTRILAGGVHSTKQQVVRIDRRTRVPADDGVRDPRDEAIRELLPEASVVMVSDYDYGLITPELGNSLARKAASLRKRTVLDSRRALRSYSGFTSATPNEPEVEAALGVRIGHDEATLEKSGRKLLQKLRMQALLVTRGSDGMVLFEPRRPTRRIPIYGSDEVADVTGAGDTVISAYALALGAGASFHEAALLANYAGGIVVMKRGTATVSPEELRNAVFSDRSR